MNLRSMLENIRTRCGEPQAQRPSDRTLLLLLSSQVQRYLNEANLSSNPWAVDETTLVVAAGQEDYPIPVDASFGKPIQIRTVYPTDPAHIERDIEFYELGDVNFQWGMPNNFQGQVDGSPNNALRIAFFRKSAQNQVYARVLPIPQQSASYQILYQIGVYGETTPLDETPFLPEHHALIELRTAFSALPHCRWSEDERINADKRKELGLTIKLEIDDLYRIYKSALATTSASRQPNYRELPFSID